jgi:hypothetical protein
MKWLQLKPRLVAGLVVLAGGIASVLVAGQRREGAESRAKVATSGAPETTRAGRVAPPSGVTRAYDVAFTLRVGAEGSPAANVVEGSTQLRLHDLPSDRVSDSVGQFSAIRISRPGLSRVELEEQRDALLMTERSLGVPFYFRRDSTGRVDRFAFAPSPQPQVLTVARVVAAALQFQSPPAPGAAAWVAEEPDANGVCPVEYKQLGPREFTKSKQNCRFANRGPASVGGVASGTIRFTRGATSVTTALELDESATLRLGDASLIASMTLKLTLRDERAEANPQPGYFRWPAGPLHDVPAPAQGDRAGVAEASARLEGKTYETLRATLQKSPQGAARADVLRDLSLLFSVNARAVSEAGEQIRGGVLDREQAEAMMAAMAGSRSPEGEAELLRLAEDRGLGAELREDAIAQLATHEAPSELTLRTLSDMATGERDEALRRQSILALGGAARHAGDDLGPVAEEAVDEIIDVAGSSSDTSGQQAAISALGNTGNVRGLPTLEAGLRSESESVRAAAAFALRFMPGQRAEELIAGALLNDSEISVRTAAASGMGYRRISPFLAGTALTSVRQESEVGVRTELFGALWRGEVQAPTSPGFAALSWMAKNDPNAGLRGRAEAALAGSARL